jgi:hypothetical protein
MRTHARHPSQNVRITAQLLETRNRRVFGAEIDYRRVESDEINVPSVARSPWLLLIPMSRQLNEQILTT